MRSQALLNVLSSKAVIDDADLQESGGAASLPCIMSIGYISAFGESLAMAVIAENTIPLLVRVLQEDSQEHMKSAAAWALGQVRLLHSTESFLFTSALIMLCCEP
jgi:Armadillo/beta-catenin-like repeat